MIITKSRVCIRCPGRIRLINAPGFRLFARRICPLCGMLYVKSRLELEQQPHKEVLT